MVTKVIDSAIGALATACRLLVVRSFPLLLPQHNNLVDEPVSVLSRRDINSFYEQLSIPAPRPYVVGGVYGTTAVPSLPVKVLHATPGFEEFEQRRRDKFDKVV